MHLVRGQINVASTRCPLRCRYLDHSIVELIVNNETAFVVYAAPASDTGNVKSDAAASLDVWTLKTANDNM